MKNQRGGSVFPLFVIRFSFSPLPGYLYPMDRMARLKEMLVQQPKDNFLRHALALEYLKINHTTEARMLFEAILTDSPDYIGSYYHLALLLAETGEKAMAIAWYEKGMEAARKAGDRHALSELQAAYEALTDE